MCRCQRNCFEYVVRHESGFDQVDVKSRTIHNKFLCCVVFTMDDPVGQKASKLCDKSE